MKNLLPYFQNKISKSKFLVYLLAKIRNQIKIIVGRHLTPTIDPSKNGEELVLKEVLKYVSIIADVGANIGQYSTLILKNTLNPIKEHHILEPSPFAFEILKKTFTSQNIYLHNLAVSDKRDTCPFYLPDKLSETASLHGVQTSKNITVEVETNTIDNLFPDKNINFLKIDTEGHDFNVLKGSENHLKQGNISFIQFEYNDAWKYAGATLHACMDYLEKYNYETFLIRKDGLYKFNIDFWDEFFRYSNFFAVKKEELHKLSHLIKGKY